MDYKTDCHFIINYCFGSFNIYVIKKKFNNTKNKRSSKQTKSRL